MSEDIERILTTREVGIRDGFEAFIRGFDPYCELYGNMIPDKKQWSQEDFQYERGFKYGYNTGYNAFYSTCIDSWENFGTYEGVLSHFEVVIQDHMEQID